MARRRADHEGSAPTRRGNQEGTFRLRDDGRYEGRVQFGPNRMSFYGDSKDGVRGAVRKARDAYEKGLDVEGSATALSEYLQSWLETVVRHVPLEVLDHAVAMHPAPVRARDAQPGQVREPAHRVEVKPIVSARPGATKGFILLENNRRDSAPLQSCRRGKSRRSSADDDDS